MNTTRGIFENFPNQAADPKDSPFAIVNEPAETPVASSPFTAVSSPFTAVAKQESPFAVVEEKKDFAKAEPALEIGKSVSPFQVAEPSEGFGFEAPSKLPAASPFEAAPTASTPAPAASPFSAEPVKNVSPSTQAAIAAFGNWQETPAVETVPFATERPFASISKPAPSSAPAADAFGDPNSDSFSIRQLELRAIFGVDREMTTEEILQRSRALPGIRNIARVSSQDMGTIEGLKSLLPNLGFGSGGLKLYLGSVPLEFIREGQVLLAVQTDGGFAPGVRETLMLVARELGRSA